MTQPFRVRPGTAADSRRAYDVFLPSVRDLAARQNSPWEMEPEAQWQRMRYLFDHLAEHDDGRQNHHEGDHSRRCALSPDCVEI